MTDPDLKRTARPSAALADPTRLLILRHLMLNGRAHVSALAEASGTVLVNASHHLGVLKAAGLLVAAPEGKRRFYSLAPAALDPVSRESVLAVLRLGHMRVAFPKTLPQDAAA